MKSMTRLTVVRLILAACALFLAGAPAHAAELLQVSPSVWRVKGVRPGGGTAAVSSVIVTSEGLVVIDGTCRTDGPPTWLRAELQRRFNRPVRYVILSHDHEDHICDLDAFDETGALTIAHRGARDAIVRERRNTSVPDITIENNTSIWLGGLEIQILYFGPTHSDNLIQVYIPSERVLIAPDFMQRGRGLVPDFRDMDVDNMLRVWNTVYRMYDIDVIVNGHGDPSTREDLLNNIRYVSTLRQRVLDEMVRGTPLPRMLETVTMPEFADWRGYDMWLRPGIVTMWDYLYRRREPNLGPAHSAWQDVVAKVLNGAAAATDVAAHANEE